MRHAFLIIAHNNFEILKYQLEILDEDNVAFYIHIDKRANFDRNELIRCVKKATVTFLKSKKISWGSFSQVDCELRLLRAASIGHYDYYHLISGVDMPLHTVNEMDAILEGKPYKEYIHFDAPTIDKMYYERIRFYHFFPGRKNWEVKLDGLIVKLQKLLKIDRIKEHSIVIQKGANWFSITDDLVQSIIKDEKNIRKMMRYSFCGDEMFLQTYIYNSKFETRLASKKYDNDYHMCLRKIDWKRGNPYVFRGEDFEELIECNDLFARKFDYQRYPEIIEELRHYLLGIKI